MQLSKLIHYFTSYFLKPDTLIYDEISLWSGIVKLRHLEFTLEPINRLLINFGIPLRLTHFHIGTFQLHIPWASLWQDSISIHVDSIDIQIENEPNVKTSQTLFQENKCESFSFPDDTDLQSISSSSSNVVFSSPSYIPSSPTKDNNVVIHDPLKESSIPFQFFWFRKLRESTSDSNPFLKLSLTKFLSTFVSKTIFHRLRVHIKDVSITLLLPSNNNQITFLFVNVPEINTLPCPVLDPPSLKQETVFPTDNSIYSKANQFKGVTREFAWKHLSIYMCTDNIYAIQHKIKVFEQYQQLSTKQSLFNTNNDIFKILDHFKDLFHKPSIISYLKQYINKQQCIIHHLMCSHDQTRYHDSILSLINTSFLLHPWSCQIQLCYSPNIYQLYKTIHEKEHLLDFNVNYPQTTMPSHFEQSSQLSPITLTFEATCVFIHITPESIKGVVQLCDSFSRQQQSSFEMNFQQSQPLYVTNVSSCQPIYPNSPMTHYHSKRSNDILTPNHDISHIRSPQVVHKTNEFVKKHPDILEQDTKKQHLVRRVMHFVYNFLMTDDVELETSLELNNPHINDCYGFDQCSTLSSPVWKTDQPECRHEKIPNKHDSFQNGDSTSSPYYPKIYGLPDPISHELETPPHLNLKQWNQQQEPFLKLSQNQFNSPTNTYQHNSVYSESLQSKHSDTNVSFVDQKMLLYMLSHLTGHIHLSGIVIFYYHPNNQNYNPTAHININNYPVVQTCSQLYSIYYTLSLEDIKLSLHTQQDKMSTVNSPLLSSSSKDYTESNYLSHTLHLQSCWMGTLQLCPKQNQLLWECTDWITLGTHSFHHIKHVYGNSLQLYSKNKQMTIRSSIKHSFSNRLSSSINPLHDHQVIRSESLQHPALELTFMIPKEVLYTMLWDNMLHYDSNHSHALLSYHLEHPLPTHSLMNQHIIRWNLMLSSFNIFTQLTATQQTFQFFHFHTIHHLINELLPYWEQWNHFIHQHNYEKKNSEHINDGTVLSHHLYHHINIELQTLDLLCAIDNSQQHTDLHLYITHIRYCTYPISQSFLIDPLDYNKDSVDTVNIVLNCSSLSMNSLLFLLQSNETPFPVTTILELHHATIHQDISSHRLKESFNSNCVVFFINTLTGNINTSILTICVFMMNYLTIAKETLLHQLNMSNTLIEDSPLVCPLNDTHRVFTNCMTFIMSNIQITCHQPIYWCNRYNDIVRRTPSHIELVLLTKNDSIPNSNDGKIIHDPQTFVLPIHHHVQLNHSAKQIDDISHYKLWINIDLVDIGFGYENHERVNILSLTQTNRLHKNWDTEFDSCSCHLSDRCISAHFQNKESVLKSTFIGKIHIITDFKSNQISSVSTKKMRLVLHHEALLIPVLITDKIIKWVIQCNHIYSSLRISANSSNAVTRVTANQTTYKESLLSMFLSDFFHHEIIIPCIQLTFETGFHFDQPITPDTTSKRHIHTSIIKFPRICKYTGESKIILGECGLWFSPHIPETNYMALMHDITVNIDTNKQIQIISNYDNQTIILKNHYQCLITDIAIQLSIDIPTLSAYITYITTVVLEHFTRPVLSNSFQNIDTYNHQERHLQTCIFFDVKCHIHLLGILYCIPMMSQSQIVMTLLPCQLQIDHRFTTPDTTDHVIDATHTRIIVYSRCLEIIWNLFTLQIELKPTSTNDLQYHHCQLSLHQTVIQQTYTFDMNTLCHNTLNICIGSIHMIIYLNMLTDLLLQAIYYHSILSEYLLCEEDTHCHSSQPDHFYIPQHEFHWSLKLLSSSFSIYLDEYVPSHVVCQLPIGIIGNGDVSCPSKTYWTMIFKDIGIMYIHESIVQCDFFLCKELAIQSQNHLIVNNGNTSYHHGIQCVISTIIISFNHCLECVTLSYLLFILRTYCISPCIRFKNTLNSSHSAIRTPQQKHLNELFHLRIDHLCLTINEIDSILNDDYERVLSHIYYSIHESPLRHKKTIICELQTISIQQTQLPRKQSMDLTELSDLYPPFCIQIHAVYVLLCDSICFKLQSTTKQQLPPFECFLNQENFTLEYLSCEQIQLQCLMTPLPLIIESCCRLLQTAMILYPSMFTIHQDLSVLNNTLTQKQSPFEFTVATGEIILMTINKNTICHMYIGFTELYIQGPSMIPQYFVNKANVTTLYWSYNNSHDVHQDTTELIDKCHSLSFISCLKKNKTTWCNHCLYPIYTILCMNDCHVTIELSNKCLLSNSHSFVNDQQHPSEVVSFSFQMGHTECMIAIDDIKMVEDLLSNVYHVHSSLTLFMSLHRNENLFNRTSTVGYSYFIEVKTFSFNILSPRHTISSNYLLTSIKESQCIHISLKNSFCVVEYLNIVPTDTSTVQQSAPLLDHHNRFQIIVSIGHGRLQITDMFTTDGLLTLIHLRDTKLTLHFYIPLVRVLTQQFLVTSVLFYNREIKLMFDPLRVALVVTYLKLIKTAYDYINTLYNTYSSLSLNQSFLSSIVFQHDVCQHVCTQYHDNQKSFALTFQDQQDFYKHCSMNCIHYQTTMFYKSFFLYIPPSMLSETFWCEHITQCSSIILSNHLPIHLFVIFPHESLHSTQKEHFILLAGTTRTFSWKKCIQSQPFTSICEQLEIEVYPHQDDHFNSHDLSEKSSILFKPYSLLYQWKFSNKPMLYSVLQHKDLCIGCWCPVEIPIYHVINTNKSQQIPYLGVLSIHEVHSLQIHCVLSCSVSIENDCVSSLEASLDTEWKVQARIRPLYDRFFQSFQTYHLPPILMRSFNKQSNNSDPNKLHPIQCIGSEGHTIEIKSNEWTSILLPRYLSIETQYELFIINNVSCSTIYHSISPYFELRQNYSFINQDLIQTCQINENIWDKKDAQIILSRFSTFNELSTMHTHQFYFEILSCIPRLTCYLITRMSKTIIRREQLILESSFSKTYKNQIYQESSLVSNKQKYVNILSSDLDSWYPRHIRITPAIRVCNITSLHLCVTYSNADPIWFKPLSEKKGIIGTFIHMQIQLHAFLPDKSQLDIHDNIRNLNKECVNEHHTNDNCWSSKPFMISTYLNDLTYQTSNIIDPLLIEITNNSHHEMIKSKLYILISFLSVNTIPSDTTNLLPNSYYGVLIFSPPFFIKNSIQRSLSIDPLSTTQLIQPNSFIECYSPLPILSSLKIYDMSSHHNPGIFKSIYTSTRKEMDTVILQCTIPDESLSSKQQVVSIDSKQPQQLSMILCILFTNETKKLFLDDYFINQKDSDFLLNCLLSLSSRCLEICYLITFQNKTPLPLFLHFQLTTSLLTQHSFTLQFLSGNDTILPGYVISDNQQFIKFWEMTMDNPDWNTLQINAISYDDDADNHDHLQMGYCSQLPMVPMNIEKEENFKIFASIERLSIVDGLLFKIRTHHTNPFNGNDESRLNLGTIIGTVMFGMKKDTPTFYCEVIIWAVPDIILINDTPFLIKMMKYNHTLSDSKLLNDQLDHFILCSILQKSLIIRPLSISGWSHIISIVEDHSTPNTFVYLSDYSLCAMMTEKQMIFKDSTLQNKELSQETFIWSPLALQLTPQQHIMNAYSNNTIRYNYCYLPNILDERYWCFYNHRISSFWLNKFCHSFDSIETQTILPGYLVVEQLNYISNNLYHSCDWLKSFKQTDSTIGIPTFIMYIIPLHTKDLHSLQIDALSQIHDDQNKQHERSGDQKMSHQEVNDKVNYYISKNRADYINELERINVDTLSMMRQCIIDVHIDQLIISINLSQQMKEKGRLCVQCQELRINLMSYAWPLQLFQIYSKTSNLNRSSFKLQITPHVKYHVLFKCSTIAIMNLSSCPQPPTDRYKVILCTPPLIIKLIYNSILGWDMNQTRLFECQYVSIKLNSQLCPDSLSNQSKIYIAIEESLMYIGNRFIQTYNDYCKAPLLYIVCKTYIPCIPMSYLSDCPIHVSQLSYDSFKKNLINHRRYDTPCRISSLNISSFCCSLSLRLTTPIFLSLTSFTIKLPSFKITQIETTFGTCLSQLASYNLKLLQSEQAKAIISLDLLGNPRLTYKLLKQDLRHFLSQPFGPLSMWLLLCNITATGASSMHRLLDSVRLNLPDSPSVSDQLPPTMQSPLVNEMIPTNEPEQFHKESLRLMKDVTRVVGEVAVFPLTGLMIALSTFSKLAAKKFKDEEESRGEELTFAFKTSLRFDDNDDDDDLNNND